MSEDTSEAVTPRVAQRPLTPSQRAATEDLGPLAAKLRVVQASDDELEARRRFELTGPPPARETSQYVVRRRISPRWRRQYTMLSLSADLLIAMVGAVIGMSLRTPVEDLRLALPFAVAFVVALTLGRVYEHRFVGSGFAEYHRLAISGLALVAATTVAGYALQAPVRGLVLIGAPLAVIVSLLWHLVARQLLFALRRRGLCAQRVVVIGTERSVAEIIRRLRREPHSGVSVVAACVSRSSANEIEGIPVAGTPDEALGVLRRHYGDTILLTAWSDVSETDLRRLSWDLEGSGAQLLVAPRLTEVAVPRMHIQTIGGLPLLYVDEPEFTGLRRVAKGGLDLGLALLALALLSPVMLAVAVAIRLDSPGPVLFRQVRIGRDSKPFQMTKFRSMHVDAEERLTQLVHLNQHGEGPLFKMREDPRVTRVGAVLRRFSLDELPQLFDVLRRRMSLVGPRPPLPREVEAYEDDVRRRLLVKPGITGLWQVSGRSDLTWDESVRLDLSYVENWSLGLDLSIIARTVVAVLARRGAY
jgi:exopolysaccharide biosynthesis polyprenyl glycosylphosphotransferase